MTAVNLNRAIRGPVTAVPVVAGKGVRIVPDTVNNRFVVEADETVLFDNNKIGTDSGELSESKLNFEYLKLIIGFNGGFSTNDGVTTHVIPSDATASWLIFGFGSGGSNLYLAGSHLTWTDSTHFSVLNGTSILKGVSSTTVSGNTSYNDGCKKCISKIIGINRISST